MKKRIPIQTYDYLRTHPGCTGRDMVEAGVSGSWATAKRHKKYFREGLAIPDSHQEVKVQIASQQEVEEEEFDAEEFLRIAPALVRAAQQHDPVLTHDTFNFGTAGPVGVIFPSCAHLGGRYTAYDEFRDIFHHILDMSHVYWASLGDDIEGFTAQFQDADAVQSQIYSVNQQYQLLNAVLTRLKNKNKLLLGVASQHGGAWTQRRSGVNPIKAMYQSFGVPFYDGKAYLKFVVGDQTYHVAIAHEFPGTSMWNSMHPQTRALRFDFPNADVVVMGDKHKWGASVIPAFPWENEAGNRKSSVAYLIQSGTAKTGPDKYSIATWGPGTLGWPVMVFYPDRHEVEYSFKLDIVEYLLTR